MSTSITLLDKNVDEPAPQPEYITLLLKQHQLMVIKKCLDIESDGVQIKDRGLINDLVDLSPLHGTDLHNDLASQPIHLRTSFGGICDVVGSGKTYSALGLIKYPLDTFIDHQQGDHMTSYHVEVDYKKQFFNHHLSGKVSLIVVPHVVLTQWRDAIRMHTTLVMREWPRDPDCPNIDVVLVGNTKYELLVRAYPRLMYKRVFFDEADSIRLPNCSKPPAMFYWFMTSSYQEMINWKRSARGFISKTLKDTPPVIKQAIMFKNDDNYVQESFKIPPYISIAIKCRANAVLTILHGIISDTIQTMICAGDITGAIESFDLAVSSDANIIDVVCQDLVIKLDNLKSKRTYLQTKHWTHLDQKDEAINKVEYEMAKIEQNIVNIKNKINESDIDPITYCEIENPVIMTCCKTVFDFESITIYMTTKAQPVCPICRTVIKKENLIRKVDTLDEETKFLHQPEAEPEYVYRDHSKTENFKYIFENKFKDGNKIILFSEYDASTNILYDNGIQFKEIKGHAITINKTVAWFNEQSSERKVLFMNSKYCGAGLNLQSCTDIIVYHSMGSELTTQVIGRAQRVGRDQPLRVYSFDENA